jgi:FKBP-type peptidyl-prolyl cis-trans isomerase 2
VPIGDALNIDTEGQTVIIRMKELSEDAAVLDFDPLAGHSLLLDIELINLESKGD